MEALGGRAVRVGLVFHATANPRCEVHRSAPSVSRQTRSHAVRAAREASQGVPVRRRERQASGKLAVRLDYLQLGLRNIVRPKKSGTEWADIVAIHEQVNVPNMVRNDDRSNSRRTFIEPSPRLGGIGGWSEWI